MVKFELINIENGVYHYAIYPEGDKSNPGSLVFNPVTKQMIRRENPKGQFDNDVWIEMSI